MTTIAYRSGVIAGDTLLCRGESCLGRMVKVGRRRDGTLGGACGDAAYIERFVDWLRGEDLSPPLPERDTGSGLVVWPDGAVVVVDWGGAFSVAAPYWALGSGRPEALGALFAGADPETAVRAAMEHDSGTGGDVIVLAREG